MDLPDELREIERRLEAADIDARHAYELVLAFRSKNGKPWTWKAWKAERNRLIRPPRAKCGDEKGPFVLQHLRQPERTTNVLLRLDDDHPDKQRRDQEYRARRDAAALSETAGGRPCCPKCGGVSIYFTKRAAVWRCNSAQGRRRCGHTFAEPAVVVTDKLRSYAAAFAELGLTARHDQGLRGLCHIIEFYLLLLAAMREPGYAILMT